ncbi:hypothetical protein C0Q70_12133 [Pomacea canaliculata]|uniref:Uncharacterized protein n=1 Tax=Pomacea canaliculata TaxID=400727 RepID=A0A2T7P0N7_POMCA|nr:hypothetical protein C0Q70_12133 [Pomacea canaliculata]
MQEVVYCKQSCSSLEFPEVSGSTVHAKEHSTVSIRFHVNTKKCEMVPDQLSILVMKKTNGRRVNQCTIRVSTGTCTLSDTSTACRCPSTDDNMLFVKRVTASDEGVYVWKWNEKGSMPRETRIRLDVSEADRELLTHHTDNQESTTEDRHEAVDPTTSERTAHDDDDDDDAWKEHPGIGKSTTVFLRHAGDLEAGAVHSVDPYIDNRVIFVVTIATCVCLVVITTVITAGIVICMKARRRHQPQMNPDLNAAFANLNGALLDLNISRDQARDIYEEIPDPPKAHRTSREKVCDCLS